MRAPVVGGPADGARVAVVSADERWIDPVAERGYRRRAPGRALYLRRGRAGTLRWEFAGHTAGHCEGCGVRIAPSEKGFEVARCELCGRREPVLTTARSM